jgi:hypothetical protein
MISWLVTSNKDVSLSPISALRHFGNSFSTFLSFPFCQGVNLSSATQNGQLTFVEGLKYAAQTIDIELSKRPPSNLQNNPFTDLTRWWVLRLRLCLEIMLKCKALLPDLFRNIFFKRTEVFVETPLRDDLRRNLQVSKRSTIFVVDWRRLRSSEFGSFLHRYTRFCPILSSCSVYQTKGNTSSSFNYKNWPSAWTNSDKKRHRTIFVVR